jgi:hypothetical protein
VTDLFHSLEHWSVAHAIAGSTTLTGSLSAAHVIGFVLVMSGALVANLRALGVLFAGRGGAELATQANRVVLAGLAVSLVTGGLLFAPRATDASANGIFQLKMLLLVAAVLVHFAVGGVAARRGAGLRLAANAVALVAWLALAVTACAFILLE